MSHFYLVVWVLIEILETEFIIMSPSIFLWNLSLFVRDLSSDSRPLLALLLKIHFREDSRRHTVIEQRVIFREIDHVKSILHSCLHIQHPIIKPLIIALRIGIILHHKVVLSVSNLESRK